MATATFEYKVRDRAGQLKTGTLDAESSSQVATKLKHMGYAPISITQARRKGAPGRCSGARLLMNKAKTLV